LVAWSKEKVMGGAKGGDLEGLTRIKQINRLVGLIDLADLRKVVSAEGSNWKLKKGEIKGYLNLKESWGGGGGEEEVGEEIWVLGREGGEGKVEKKDIENAIRRLHIGE